MKLNYKAMFGHLRAGLLIGTCGIALSGITVHAQTPTPQNPNTSQTDQSEEDWRKSRKKRDTTDIFEDILNPGSTGRGAYQTGPINPIDSLPDSSRRHLNKERAKALAEAPIGAPINTDYTPSKDAQADPDLEEQEKLAWSEMMSDVNNGMGADPGSGQGGAPKPNSGQGQNQGQGQGQGSETDAGEQSKMPSLMRGGSSASIADILAGIKGGQTSEGPEQGTVQGTGQGTSRGTGQDIQSGRSQNGEAQQGGGETVKGNETASGTENGTNTSSGESSGQSGQASANAMADNSANGSQQDSGSSASENSNSAQSQDASASQNQAEPMSPLERAQSDRSRTTGNRTSASDYLNRFKKKRD